MPSIDPCGSDHLRKKKKSRKQVSGQIFQQLPLHLMLFSPFQIINLEVLKGSFFLPPLTLAGNDRSSCGTRQYPDLTPTEGNYFLWFCRQKITSDFFSLFCQLI
jgi:hypothetical protein